MWNCLACAGLHFGRKAVSLVYRSLTCEYHGFACAAYDLDLLVRYETTAIPASACNGILARAGTRVRERVTGRPILGNLEFCDVDVNDLPGSLQIAVHEILHIMVRLPLGTSNGQETLSQ